MSGLDALAVTDAAIDNLKSAGYIGNTIGLQRTRDAMAELIKQSKRAEEFLVYLLTHAPELPDENGVVFGLRAALRGVGAIR